MLFAEALDLLKSGEIMHRKAWAREDGYLSLMCGMLYIWKILLHPQPNAGNYIFTVEDLTSNDWQVFKLDCPPVVIDAPVVEGEAVVAA